jgi:hypothetical protein
MALRNDTSKLLCPAFNLSAANFVQSSLGYTLHFEMPVSVPPTQHTSFFIIQWKGPRKVYGKTEQKTFVLIQYKLQTWTVKMCLAILVQLRFLTAVQLNDSRKFSDRGRFIVRILRWALSIVKGIPDTTFRSVVA